MKGELKNEVNGRIVIYSGMDGKRKANKWRNGVRARATGHL